MATTNFDVIQTVPRVATLIYQTHQLWQEIKNVPDGIMGLVDQLKALESIFSDIEDQFNEDGASASFKNCLELSKKAHDSLGVLVADMRTQLQANKKMKRKYAAVKILLNKAVLERLEQSLSRCMTFLQLAIQAYQMAMLRKLSSQTTSARFQPQHHAQVQQLLPQQPQKKMPHNQTERDEDLIETEEVIERSRKTTDLFTFSFAQHLRFALARTKSTGAWQVQLQVPKWLSTSVYEFISAPAIAGWTYTYRVYNIIPNDSEIIKKINSGDLIGVREMFNNRDASPFDRNAAGGSLLYYAASSQQYEICQLLLKMGLQSLLDHSEGHFSSPIESIAGDISSVTTWPTERHPRRIADLFASYLQEPDALPAERLLDFIREFEPNDKKLSDFRSLFMPNYYLRLLRDRLEAVRLGAFNVIRCKTLESLVSKDGTITQTDVVQSSREKVSLVHSAALALGCRYPERLMTCFKPCVWLRIYEEDWGDFVTNIARMATLDDLISVETVVPWDVYEVTAWKGTPLISVIGGALCYLCPGISFNHWDALFHGCLYKWLSLLDTAGVDILGYGKKEVSILHDLQSNTKGAFDADAVEESRTMLRHPMLRGDPLPKIHRATFIDRRGEQYWLPFRIIDLQIGPEPTDWKLKWAPEFEYMACQFWMSVENHETAMPGSWVEC
ncbi:hypothetical protein CFAM422_011211 [Trichoderma lentiforme]|uniref:Ankyrin repeat protein n=1 Tax=Trichoderma lentiforme TaxID=1567552 RepID=A0A9P4X7D4_9HYPO|nr:hypothetical protein CFAM422_011211 [Trichoderma lentiforme]